MRPFSARSLPNTVLVRKCSYPVGTQGGVNPTPQAPGTTFPATVQTGTDYVRVADLDGSTRYESRTRGRIGFASDPGVIQGDEITWTDGGNLTFTAQGTATPDGGRSPMLWVDVELNY